LDEVDDPGDARDRVAELGLPGEVGFVSRLLRLHRVVQRLLDGVAAGAGLSGADALVITVVSRAAGQRATPAQVSEVLDRSSGGTSLALDRLERTGLVRRVSDGSDRRRVWVELTPEGRAVAARVQADVHRFEAGLGVAEPELADLRRALDRLLALLEPTGG